MSEYEVQEDALAGGDVGLVRWQDYVHPEPFVFGCGKPVTRLTQRYETYGTLAPDRSNAIFVCHALSGDHHCAGRYEATDRKPGWWNHIIGSGKPLDTRRFFIICSNCIGGCQGSTGPSSVHPENGSRYNLDFPELTIRDMVKAQKLLCDHLGLPRLYAVVGGSMGGMKALQWAIEYPDFVERILVLASTARSNAQSIAFNEVGRLAIMHDPAWAQGNYEPEAGPRIGLSIARMMAHITYLSDEGLELKFGRQRRPASATQGFLDVEFEVESYLRYQGASFVNRFDANTYLYLTKALDRFDLYGGAGSLDAAFAPMRARALVVGFSSDWLYPPQQNRDIVHAMLRAGKDATYAEIHMDYGHDSFLVDAPQLFNLVRAFLGTDTPP